VTPRRARSLAALLFVLSRAYLLLAFHPRESDIYIYRHYADEAAQARAEGTGVYSFHAAKGGVIEYPPLAVRWMSLPRTLVGADAYATAYRALVALMDASAFGLLLWLVPRSFPTEAVGRHLERWLVYVVSGVVLGHLLYDRLDLVVGVLVLGTLALLAAPAMHSAFGLAVLVLAVYYKLVPIVLAPVCLLATVSRAALQTHTRELARVLAARSIVFVLLLVAPFIPIAGVDGAASLGFLRYHADRGLHVESVPASLLLGLSFFGHRVALVDEFGAWSIRSALSPALVALSPLLALGLPLAVAVTMWRSARTHRRSGLSKTSDVGLTPAEGATQTSGAWESTRWAAADPAPVAGFVLAALAAAIVGSKVFSPQYLLWLLPLAPLVPASRRAVLWLFTLVAALTTVVFPYRYDDVVAGPTAVGALLLLLRNAAMVGLALVTLRAATRATTDAST
jgi:hypothetical protein